MNPKLNLLIFTDLLQLHMILEKCSEDSFQCLIRGATFAHMKAVDMSSTYEHQTLLYACRDWLNYGSIISRLLMSLLKLLKFFLIDRDLESWEHAKNQNLKALLLSSRTFWNCKGIFRNLHITSKDFAFAKLVPQANLRVFLCY